MADDKGRAIEAGAPRSSLASMVANDNRPPVCVACGIFHGSVGVHVHCLGDEVLRLRRELVAAGRPDKVRR